MDSAQSIRAVHLGLLRSRRWLAGKLCREGSVVRGIPWFSGMSMEDSELVTGSGGSRTAYRGTGPIRKRGRLASRRSRAGVFPGGTVVKAVLPQQGHRFDPWSGN